MGLPLREEDIRLNPEESHLSQRFKTTLRATNVAAAMIGNVAEADKIPCFSDEEIGIFLKDWMCTIWVKRDNYQWSDEQVARLIVECCRGRAQVALDILPLPGGRIL